MIENNHSTTADKKEINPKLTPTNMAVPTTTSTTCTTKTTHSTRRRSFEESYVDTMQGRRSLADVMDQFDGLGPSRRRRISETSLRPRRRSEVSSKNEQVSNHSTHKAPPVRQRALTPRAESSLFEDDGVHGTDTGLRGRYWPAAISSRKRSYSLALVHSILDDAIAIVEADKVETTLRSR
jgi:hypothetical protein